MNYCTPKLVYYGQTLDQAINIICRRKLLNCEPENQPIQGLIFQDENDLIACALVFNDSIEIEGKLVIMPTALRSKVEDLIDQMSMEDRVDWIDLLGVRFWDSNDERAFNEELDAVWRRSSTAAPSRLEPQAEPPCLSR
jgi:S-adenosylmethionine:tRNA-ribosyltransferase-isomerase (queuine synthetase)